MAWLTTVDHKRIGILYGSTALVFFLVAGLEALLIRLQLARPDGQLIGAQRYNELFTMHGTTHGVPGGDAAVGGLLQLPRPAHDRRARRGVSRASTRSPTGSSSSAASSSTRAGSVGTPPDAGWFGYAPLTSKPFSIGPRLGLLAARPHLPRDVEHPGVAQLPRDDPQPAGAGDDVPPAAALRLDHPRHQRPHPPRLPADHGRARLPDVRPLLRHPLLHRRPAGARPCSGSTCSGSSATPRSTS